MENYAPPALGKLRSQLLHHWDLQVGRPRKVIDREVAVRAGQAVLALASRCSGVAIDEYGFPISSPDDLLPH
jgi:hypothetical protein